MSDSTDSIKTSIAAMSGNPKTVLVLDLDETLVRSFYTDDRTIASIKAQDKCGDRLQSIKYTEKYDGIEEKHEMITILRPHIDNFLDYIQTDGMFKKIVVWTAGTEAYAEQIVKKVFSDYPPDLVWARKKCVVGPDGNYTKPLKVLADALGVRVENLLILDDMHYSVQLNTNHGLNIKGYNPISGADDEDDALAKLVKFFKSPHFYSYRYSHECDRDKIGW